MIDESQLSQVLGEMATTLATDFTTTAVLDRLVGRIVQVLPVASAGLSLIDDNLHPHYVAASDADARAFEDLQSALSEGPCLMAFESGEPVAVPDLAHDPRFPRFGPAAVAAGLAAVHTFPLRQGSGRFGALDLYLTHPGDLSPVARESAQTLAAVAAAYLLMSRARTDAIDLRHLALHDELTGLPNKLMLESRIQHAGSRADRSGAAAAVIFIDLDDFKQVNDVHGHLVGDLLLRSVARRLSSVIRPADTLARIYGDEFVLLCEDLEGDHPTEGLVRRIRNAFSQPFEVKGTSIAISASVGVAFTGPGQKLSSQHIADADRAMYDDKAGRTSYRPNRLREIVSRSEARALSRDLAHALLHDALDLTYHPVVRLEDGVVTGMLAAPVWRRNDGQVLHGRELLDEITENGLLRQLFRWCRTRSVAEAVAWPANGTRELELHVTMPAVLLTFPGMDTEVSDCLAGTGLDADRLVINLCGLEEVDLDLPGYGSRLSDLKALGVHLSIEGFGTRGASLDSLHQLPVDMVHVDAGFLTAGGPSDKGTTILSGVADLADRLDLAVVVAGVDTQEQRTAARAATLTHATGRLYSEPLSHEQVEELLAGATDPLRLPRPAP